MPRRMRNQVKPLQARRPGAWDTASGATSGPETRTPDSAELIRRRDALMKRRAAERAARELRERRDEIMRRELSRKASDRERRRAR